MPTYNDIQSRIARCKYDMECLRKELADLEKQQDDIDTPVRFGDVVVEPTHGETRLITFSDVNIKELAALDASGYVQSWEPKRMRPHYQIIGNVFDINITNWMKQIKSK